MDSLQSTPESLLSATEQLFKLQEPSAEQFWTQGKKGKQARAASVGYPLLERLARLAGESPAVAPRVVALAVEICKVRVLEDPEVGVHTELALGRLLELVGMLRSVLENQGWSGVQVLELLITVLENLKPDALGNRLRVLGLVIHHLMEQLENYKRIVVAEESEPILYNAMILTAKNHLKNTFLHKDVCTKIAFVLLLGWSLSTADSAEVVLKIEEFLCSNEFPFLSKLAVLRAGIAIESDSLLVPSSGEKTTPLFVSALSFILDGCDSHDAPLRLYSIETLNAWLCKFIEYKRKDSSLLKNLMANSLEMGNIIDTVLKILVLNWEHRFQAIPKALRGLFKTYLDFLDFDGPISSSNISTDLVSLASKILSLSDDLKSKFEMMKSILPKFSSLGGIHTLFNLNPDLIYSLLNVAGNNRVWSSASKVLLDILQLLRLELKDDEKWRMQWTDAIIHVLSSAGDLTHFSIKALQAHVLPKLVKADPASLEVLLGLSKDVMISLIILKEGKESISSELISFPTNIMIIRNALSDSRDIVRLEAVALLCESKKSTELPDIVSLKLLRESIPNFFIIEDMSFKDRIIHLLLRLFIRIRDGLYRCAQNTKLDQRERELQDHTCEFANWLHSCLLRQVYPGIPVERASAVLDILVAFHSTFHDEFLRENSKKYAGDHLVRIISQSKKRLNSAKVALLKTLETSWNQVRSSCLFLLVDKSITFSDTEIATIFPRALHLIQQAKLSDSESGCVILQILLVHSQRISDFCLIKNVDVKFCESNRSTQFLLDLLHQKMPSKLQGSPVPLQGILMSIRTILENNNWEFEKQFNYWGCTLEKIIEAAALAMDIAMQYHYKDPNASDGKVVLVDCRGHAIFDSQEDGTDDLAGSSGVVSTWHVVKESALLLAETLTVLVRYGTYFPVTVSKIKLIGQSLIIVLLRAKHNGVIQKVHLALTKVCRELLLSDNTSFVELVWHWTNQLLDLVEGRKTEFLSRENSWIRRSAGLPFAFLAILHAQPDVKNRKILDSVIPRLINEAKLSVGSDTWQVKVHALNILRAILRDSILAVNCMQYVSDCLLLTLEGFSHEIWAVRNSSLMAFTAIVQLSLRASQANVSEDRTFGKGLSLHEFFHQFPPLKPLIFQTFSSLQALKTSEIAPPTIQPLLLIISRLFKSSSENDDHIDLESSMVKLILDYLSSSANYHFHGRAMACRAIIGLDPCLEETMLKILIDMQESLPNSNTLHGHVLILETAMQFRKDCLAAFKMKQVLLSKLVTLSSSLLERLLVSKNFLVRLSLHRFCLQICLQCQELTSQMPALGELHKTLIRSCISVNLNEDSSLTGFSDFYAESSSFILLVFLISTENLGKIELSDFISCCLSDNNAQMRNEILSTILSLWSKDSAYEGLASRFDFICLHSTTSLYSIIFESLSILKDQSQSIALQCLSSQDADSLHINFDSFESRLKSLIQIGNDSPILSTQIEAFKLALNYTKYAVDAGVCPLSNYLTPLLKLGRKLLDPKNLHDFQRLGVIESFITSRIIDNESFCHSLDDQSNLTLFTEICFYGLEDITTDVRELTCRLIESFTGLKLSRPSEALWKFLRWIVENHPGLVGKVAKTIFDWLDSYSFEHWSYLLEISPKNEDLFAPDPLNEFKEPIHRIQVAFWFLLLLQNRNGITNLGWVPDRLKETIEKIVHMFEFLKTVMVKKDSIYFAFSPECFQTIYGLSVLALLVSRCVTSDEYGLDFLHKTVQMFLKENISLHPLIDPIIVSVIDPNTSIPVESVFFLEPDLIHLLETF